MDLHSLVCGVIFFEIYDHMVICRLCDCFYIYIYIFFLYSVFQNTAMKCINHQLKKSSGLLYDCKDGCC